MDDKPKPTEEEKVTECWEAFQSGGLEGLKKLAHKRNEEHRKSIEESCQIQDHIGEEPQ